MKDFVLTKDADSEETPEVQPAQNSIRPYLLGAGLALTVGYFAFRLFKRSSGVKALR